MGVIDSIKKKMGRDDDTAEDASPDERGRRSGKRLRNPEQGPGGRDRGPSETPGRGPGGRGGPGQGGQQTGGRDRTEAGPGGPEPPQGRGRGAGRDSPGGRAQRSAQGPGGGPGGGQGTGPDRQDAPGQEDTGPGGPAGQGNEPDFAAEAGLDEPTPPRPTGQDAAPGRPEEGPRRGMLSRPDQDQRPPGQGPQTGEEEGMQGVRDDLHQITQQNERIIDLLRQIKNKIR